MRSLIVTCLMTLAAASDETSFSVVPEYEAYGNPVLTQTLLSNQTFGNSWDTPSDTQYSPPLNPSDFNRVVLELSVTSTGGNYDRLGQLFLDDVEIWRTSTAEPDNNGMKWSATKDVSHYALLFQQDHTLNFLIQNRVTNQFTGVFEVTLVAHYYNATGSQSKSDDGWAVDLDNPPTSIHPLSKTANTPSVSWSAPNDDISVDVPALDRSVNRALLHVFASGNGGDEFWWDSALNNGAGPARFIDVHVGSYYAGYVAPYPVVYTGGVNAYLWRPLTAIRTFDIPAYFIDITPFLPELWNGTSISLEISNGIDSETIPSNWIINYNLFTWSTDGQSNSGSINEPNFVNQSTWNGGEQLVTRNLTTSASLQIGGKSQNVQWQQAVSYNNTQQGSPTASNSHVWQATQGYSNLTGLYSFSQDHSYYIQAQLTNNQYYRVQQEYDVDAENQAYSSWVDSSVNLDSNGALLSSDSSQYLSGAGAAHFARTHNLNVVQSW